MCVCACACACACVCVCFFFLFFLFFFFFFFFLLLFFVLPADHDRSVFQGSSLKGNNLLSVGANVFLRE